MQIYLLGLITAFILVMRDLYTTDEKNSDISTVAPLVLLSWVTVFYYMWKKYKELKND